MSTISDVEVAGISKVLQVTPLRLCASEFTSVRRQRLYWLSWSWGPGEDYSTVALGPKMVVHVPGTPPEVEEWADPGWTTSSPRHVLPPFGSAGVRRVPPCQPAGLSRSSEAAVERWHRHLYITQVHNFEDANLMHHIGRLEPPRLPSICERERLMGYDDGYTAAAVSAQEDPVFAWATRASLIGNGFAIQPVAWLLGHLAGGAGGLQAGRRREAACSRSVSFEPWLEAETFGQEADNDPVKCTQVVKAYLRVAERGGSDVRLDAGLPYRKKGWPRAGIHTRRWARKILHGCPWNRVEGSTRKSARNRKTGRAKPEIQLRGQTRKPEGPIPKSCFGA